MVLKKTICLMVILGCAASSDPLSWMQPPRKKGSYPSVNPSPFPSQKPTKMPMQLVRVSPKPSSKPSAILKQSQTPSSKNWKTTILPSAAPKVKLSPSSVPSIAPSGKPSIRPSSRLSSKPSLKPFKFTPKPSKRPSIRLSFKPSLKPSSALVVVKPSKRPSSRRSSKPSFKPPSMSAEKPSLKPSSTPKADVSSMPTRYPQPVTRPTRFPSVRTNHPMLPLITPIAKTKSRSPTIPRAVSNKPVRSLGPSIYRSFHPSTSPMEYSTRAPTETRRTSTSTPTTRMTHSVSGLQSKVPTLITYPPTSAVSPSTAILTNVSLPAFSLELYLDTSKAFGSLRKLQTIGTLRFDDSELTKIVQSSLFQGFSSRTNIVLLFVSPLSQSFLTVNKTGTSSALVWVTCEYSGFVSFGEMMAVISNYKLGQLILSVFGTSPNVDEFILSLHATNNSYLQAVKSVKVRLLTDSNSSNAETINASRRASRVPYVVVGSVLSFIILSVAAYFVYKKNKVVAGYKSTESIPSTPHVDSDFSPGDDGESAKQVSGKKNTTLLGIEAKDVYIESPHQADDCRNDSLSSICISLTRILEERGLPPKEYEAQPTRTSLGKMCSDLDPSPTTDSAWTLIPNPDTKPSYDEYDTRNCCGYSPMQNETTRRMFDKALTSNPLYHEFTQPEPMMDPTPMVASPTQHVSLPLTPMPKKRCESFDMRNRDESCTQLDDEEAKKALCSLSPSFPIMPSPLREEIPTDPSATQIMSPRLTLDTKLSYEEYGVQNCCNLDTDLKKRLFGQISL